VFDQFRFVGNAVLVAFLVNHAGPHFDVHFLGHDLALLHDHLLRLESLAQVDDGLSDVVFALQFVWVIEEVSWVFEQFLDFLLVFQGLGVSAAEAGLGDLAAGGLAVEVAGGVLAFARRHP